MRRFIAASMLMLAVPTQAVAAPCLTPAEFTAVTTYTLPSMIRGTSQRCASQLGADAYLRRNGDSLASRYAARRTSAWPGAKAAFLKLSAATSGEAGNLIRNLPDTSMQPMLDALMEGMVAQRLPLDRCGTIDRMIGLLSPLPPESAAELIAVAVGLGAKSGGGKLGAISLCPA
ncbi:MAG TPA: hypothetical protein VGE05_10210 [Novosphingobium sp.]